MVVLDLAPMGRPVGASSRALAPQRVIVLRVRLLPELIIVIAGAILVLSAALALRISPRLPAPAGAGIRNAAHRPIGSFAIAAVCNAAIKLSLPNASFGELASSLANPQAAPSA
ncbi:MAG: hypothetical protein WA005_01710 [Candidatus Binataceae bacterium]